MWEVYIGSILDLDQLAETIRSLLNIPGSNSTQGSERQRRDSVNWGGVYWLFEVLGLKLRLLTNAGEVAIDEYHGYGHYLAIEAGSEMVSKAVAIHVAELLASKGFDVAVDHLA